MITELRTRAADAVRRHAPAGSWKPSGLGPLIEAAASRQGRLIRGCVVLGASEAFGAPGPEAVRMAAAVEFWHTASLVLDDLPSMDDAMVRRGEPCLHLSHGEGPAILAALALIHQGYMLVVDAFSGYPALARKQVFALVDRALGPSGTIGGQAADLAHGHPPRHATSASAVALRKTAALLELCLCLPAIAADTGPAVLGRLRRLAVYWGLAYQAIDDLADRANHRVDSRKSAMRDAALGRPSLALEVGEKEACRRVARLQRLALAQLHALGGREGHARPLMLVHDTLCAASKPGLCACA